MKSDDSMARAARVARGVDGPTAAGVLRGLGSGTFEAIVERIHDAA